MKAGTGTTHEESARRALLQRLATGLAIISEPERYEWTCCWLSYDRYEHYMDGKVPVRWGWQFCGGQAPGSLPVGPDRRHITCGHWHHRFEVFLA